jgi:hypothetical protein
MVQPIDRPGSFRANITSYGLKQFDSGAVAVAIKAELVSMFYDGQWGEWPAGDHEAEGLVWIIKKKDEGGGINENGVKSLINFAGWDGNIESIQSQTWQTTPCVVVVTEDTYKDKKQLRISFVNDYNRTPGGAMSNIDDKAAKELQARFGGSLRALAGNKARNETMPKDRPAPPPLAPPPTQNLVSSNGKDLPF